MNPIAHPGYVPLGIKIKRTLWNVTSIVLFRPFGTKVFRPWRLFLLRLFGAKVDRNAEVYASCKIWAPWNLDLKSHTCLGPNTICYNQALVILEENATLSQYSYLCTAGHESDRLLTAGEGLITGGITLKRNSWVGTHAFVGMGVIVGEAAIVGANAGVYKDVEPYTIVGGNPAKKLRERILK